MDTSPSKPKPLAKAPKKEEIDAEAAAATQAKLKQKAGYFKTALAGETGGFGGQTALG